MAAGEAGFVKDDVHECDKSSSGSVTVDVGVEHPINQATTSPDRGHLRTLRHRGTVSGLCRPTVSPSTWSIESSNDDRDVPPRSGDVDSPSTMSTSSGDPTAHRPGHFSDIEILQRIFPRQRRTVLDRMLSGCNGDLAKAIGRLLCTQNEPVTGLELLPQPALQLQQLWRQQPNTVAGGGHGRPAVCDAGGAQDARWMPAAAAAADAAHDRFVGRSAPIQYRPALADSAFLRPPSAALWSNGDFTPRPPAFTTDALLGLVVQGRLPPPLYWSRPPLPIRPQSAAIGACSPRSTAAATPKSLTLLGHRQHHHGTLHPGLVVEHYIRQMMVAAAASSAVGRAPLPAGARVGRAPAGTGPAVTVASSSAGHRGMMTSHGHLDTSGDQAPNHQ